MGFVPCNDKFVQNSDLVVDGITELGFDVALGAPLEPNPAEQFVGKAMLRDIPDARQFLRSDVFQEAASLGYELRELLKTPKSQYLDE